MASVCPKPTPEQVDAARSDLAERLRRQELVRQTLLAKHDPVTLQLIDEALCALKLSDPDGRFREAMARHGRDAIAEGISIFSMKSELGTLPPGVDIRYLLGIVANVAHDNELCELTEQLIAERRRARDIAFSHLAHQPTSPPAHQRTSARAREREGAEQKLDSPLERIEHHADTTCNSTRNLDRLFWLEATADVSPIAPQSSRRQRRAPLQH